MGEEEGMASADQAGWLLFQTVPGPAMSPHRASQLELEFTQHTLDWFKVYNSVSIVYSQMVINHPQSNFRVVHHPKRTHGLI